MKSALLFAAAITAALPALPAAAHPHEWRRYESDHGRWARGQHLPPHYRGRGYIVSDYQRYHLRPPPRGYYYVRHGDDLLLTVIASGLIAAVIANADRGRDRDRGYDDAYDRGGSPYRAPAYAGSGVDQGPDGQTVWSDTPAGRSYVEQGPDGQTIVTEGPDGRTYTRQGPGGQTIRRTPPPGY